MKKIITFCIAFLTTAILFAQVPEKISYQAVVRDGSNNLISSTAIRMKISILQGSANGTVVYSETQIPSSNSNGLVTVDIGGGTVVSGAFASIDWANGTFFIKTEIDLTGGTNYSVTGTSQLLSVPFAMNAKTVDIESDPIYNSSVASRIGVNDTTYWNNKLDSYIETDSIFTHSVAARITTTDITNWNKTKNTIEVKDSIFIGKILSRGNSFAGDSAQPGLATMSNISQTEDKILNKIYFFSLDTGTQRFGIGTLDQRNLGIIEQEFELDVKKGINEINVFKYGYKIPANQQLFAYYHYSDMTELLSWNPYSSTDDTTSFMLYGSTMGKLNPIATPFGGYINLKYDLVSIESLFTTKNDFEQVKATAEKALSIATKAYNKIGLVSDRSGNKYKLVIQNSELQIIQLMVTLAIMVCCIWQIQY
jgi:hypothetical protein